MYIIEIFLASSLIVLQYPAVLFQANGTTCLFFEKSDISDYKNMWAFMNSTAGVLVPETSIGIQKVKDENYAFLMESSSLQYTVSNIP